MEQPPQKEWYRERNRPLDVADLRAAFVAGHEAGHEAHVEIGVSSLSVKITEEGVIMDAFDNDLNEIVGTLAMTYDEWFDFVCKHDPAQVEDIEGVWE